MKILLNIKNQLRNIYIFDWIPIESLSMHISIWIPYLHGGHDIQMGAPRLIMMMIKLIFIENARFYYNKEGATTTTTTIAVYGGIRNK